MLKLTLGVLLVIVNLVQVADTNQHYQNSTNLGQLVLLITFFVNIAVQLWRERRDRKWKIEDAQRQQKELEDHEARMKAEIGKKADEIKANARTRVADLGVQLDALLNGDDMSQQEDKDERRKA